MGAFSHTQHENERN
uniref:Uncharacterized protein n=1 Tax=Rhizophora mucronata TaxID=61149 RepID=A0A2P2K704_RHIMU